MCFHIYTGALKREFKRSLKISFSNKSRPLQQIYSGKCGNFESRFLTLHHLSAGKTNWFGKQTSCSVDLCWNMQSWECAGGFTAVTCRQANIALSQSQPPLTLQFLLFLRSVFYRLWTQSCFSLRVSVTGSLFPVQAWWDSCCSKHYPLTFVHP